MAKPVSKEKVKAPTGKSLQLYLLDPQVKPLLTLLRDKWYAEGKIEQPTYAKVVGHMAHNFGEMAKNPPREDGSLPLDPKRRKKLQLLGEAFRLVGMPDAKTDLDVVNLGLDYLFEIFKDEQFLDRFIKAKGQI